MQDQQPPLGSQRSKGGTACLWGSCPAEIPPLRLGSEPICQIMVGIHQLAESLGCAIDLRDRYTQNHSTDVAAIAKEIAKGMELAANTCDMVDIAGHLHDIGKIGISDDVLKNRGKLSDQQWLEMRKHPLLGYEMLKGIKGLNQEGGVADMVLYHHERWDGSGYPEGLRGEEIPLGSRILAVADSYSAMVDDRRYRQGVAPQAAMAEIRRWSGTLYDPRVVTVFENIAKSIN